MAKVAPRRFGVSLISKQLLCRVIKTDIKAYYDSDHSPVTISIGPEEKHGQRGPGFWKFNNSLLENEEFVLKMKFIIINAKEKYKDVTDARTFWEMVKMEIRIFSIWFPKEKAKDKRNTELELLRKLENLNAQIDASPNDDHLVSEAQTIKIKLDQIAEQKTKSSIVRSRTR